MVITKIEDCKVSNSVLLTLISAVLLAIAGITVTGSLNASQATGALVFSIIFVLLGVVAMLKDISIVRCPARILVGAIGFIALTSVLDKYLF